MTAQGTGHRDIGHEFSRFRMPACRRPDFQLGVAGPTLEGRAIWARASPTSAPGQSASCSLRLHGNPFQGATAIASSAGVGLDGLPDNPRHVGLS